MMARKTKKLIEVVNGIAIVNPHYGQKQTITSDARNTWIVAGAQSGKTSWGPIWLKEKIQERGPGDYLAVTSTYDLFKLKMMPELLTMFGGYDPAWYYHKTDRVIYSNDHKTRIILRSASSESGLESSTAKAAWLDECGMDEFPLSAKEAIDRRLALNEGPLLGTTTVYNLGWLYSEVYRPWQRGDRDHKVIQFESTMNPVFPQAEFERAKAKLPRWKFDMFYRGVFTRPAGMILESFDPDIHEVAAFEMPPSWPRYVGIDPGAPNMAQIWIAENPSKNIFYVYRSTVEGTKTTKEHAAKALELAQHENVLGWALGAKSEVQFQKDWRSEGVPVQAPKIVDVEAGLDRIIELFKTKRLFVFDTCSNLLDQIGTYSRVLDDLGQPTAKIKNKEKYHLIDALRYAVQLLEMPAVDDLVAGA